MSYVNQNLMKGERVVYRAKLHRIVFKWAAFWCGLGLIALLGSTVSAQQPGADAPITGHNTILVLFAFGAITAVIAFLNYATSEFAVTNRRLVVKTGVIHRASLETLLDTVDVEGVAVKQGLLARMFGYGTVIVNGTGPTKTPFKRISQPFEFRHRIQEQIEDCRQESNRGTAAIHGSVAGVLQTRPASIASDAGFASQCATTVIAPETEARLTGSSVVSVQ